MILIVSIIAYSVLSLSIILNLVMAYRNAISKRLYIHASNNFDWYIEALSEMQSSKWISVNDELPPERIAILCLIPEEDHEVAVCIYEQEQGFYLSYDDRKDLSVEYWCRIPQHLKINENVKI